METIEFDNKTHKCRYMNCNIGKCKNVNEECYEIDDYIDEGRFTCFSSGESN